MMKMSSGAHIEETRKSSKVSLSTKVRRIFIVIPVHNRIAETLTCLQSLSLQTYRDIIVIVVDDGSTDGTAVKVKENFPDTIILKGDGDLWWTAATNLGVQWALDRAEQRDCILTLNNDTVVNPDYAEQIISAVEQNPRALIGSVAVNSADRRTIVDGGVRVNWFTAKHTVLAVGKTYDEILQEFPRLVKVDVLPGRGTLIPVEVFKMIGLYNARQLPHYGADYEFSRRAKNNGYELVVDYKAVVLSNVKTTGMNNESEPMGWGDLWRSFFSRRSAYNTRYRWNFIQLACPRLLMLTFCFLDFNRVLLGRLRNQFRKRMRT